MKTSEYTLFLILLASLLLSCNENNIPKKVLEISKTPDQMEIFGESFISTQLYERDIAITPDGSEIFYTLGDYKQNVRCIVSCQNTESGWSLPRLLDFSGEHQDIEPFYDAVKDRLYFASNRPIFQDSTRSDYNIWFSQRQEGKWHSPQPLDSLINTTGDEFFPSLGNSGNLYFTATRQDGIGREDIFYSQWSNDSFSSPTPLDSNINTQAYEFNAYITPDENLIVFSSYGRADGLGGGDLYYSSKNNNGHWSPAKNLGPEINSVKLDYCPFIDLERGNFYFTSEKMSSEKTALNSVGELKAFASSALNGHGNIYRIRLNEVEFHKHLSN